MGEEQFGNYRLDRLLGRGGMGEVWLARDTEGGREVALKVLSENLASDREYRRRFEREARLGSTLRNPHIVRIHGFGEQRGRLFIAMDYIDGIDLAEMLGRVRTLAPAAAVDFVTQVASGLDAAHRAGLIHRDVKPSNILIDNGGHAYLIDFGIAKGVGQTAVTATGMAIGSWPYMAPERFNGTVDARSDIYSLACVLYECLTGRRPYGDTDPPRQMHDHLRATPPRAASVNPSVPAALDAVIGCGMAKDQAARYPSARDFADAARAAVGSECSNPRVGSPVAPLVPPPPPSATPKPRTKLLEQSGPTPTVVVTGRSQPSPPLPPPVASGGPTPDPLSVAGAQSPVPSAPRPPTPTKVMPEPGPTPTLVVTRLAPSQVPPPVRGVLPQPNSRHAPYAPARPGPAFPPPVPVQRPAYQPKSKRQRGGSVAPLRWSVSRGRRWIAPPATAPRRGRRRPGGVLTKVIGALVVVFLTPFVLAAGCIALMASGSRVGDSSGGSNAPRPTAAAEEHPVPPPDPGPAGPATAQSAVRDGKFEFVVTGADSGFSRVGFQSARGSFTIVTVTVNNVSDQSKWFLPFGQHLIDTRGRVIDHDPAATMWQTAQGRHNYSFELHPGQSATTQLVFDVAPDSTPSHLELHDFPLSQGVTVMVG
ncbi:protein kinase [Nocardia sp. NPDC051463]|uniref:serine/threonine-protein kinase n=1 Tax=Nocardia sp. NPDC051463 TaxID=3154845 RepID=UPI00341997A7